MLQLKIRRENMDRVVKEEVKDYTAVQLIHNKIEDHFDKVSGILDIIPVTVREADILFQPNKPIEIGEIVMTSGKNRMFIIVRPIRLEQPLPFLTELELEIYRSRSKLWRLERVV